MADIVAPPFAAAIARGRELAASGTLASEATYDPASQTLRIQLQNGCRAEIPVALIESLATATDPQRAHIVIEGIGYGLHWPDLDLDLAVPALLADVFGTSVWMNCQRARSGGAATSAAKAQASRNNGAKGGRPRKIGA